MKKKVAPKKNLAQRVAALEIILDVLYDRVALIERRLVGIP